MTVKVGVRKNGKIEIHSIDFDMDYFQAIKFVKSQIPHANPVLVEINCKTPNPVDDWTLPKVA